ncbi:MAG: AraC family transcriptional regulator, partial [Sphingobacterium sp.]|nr:AraC family transcriptional regulator [Sphingobacterium sp.]
TVLQNYFDKKLHLKEGLPTVNYLAGELFLSSRYLSDLLKQETGKTALEHVHIYLIKEAKNLLLGSDSNISGIAYDLGFESPSYFTRLFKKLVGVTPAQFKEAKN